MHARRRSDTRTTLFFETVVLLMIGLLAYGVFVSLDAPIIVRVLVALAMFFGSLVIGAVLWLVYSYVAGKALMKVGEPADHHESAIDKALNGALYIPAQLLDRCMAKPSSLPTYPTQDLGRGRLKRMAAQEEALTSQVHRQRRWSSPHLQHNNPDGVVPLLGSGLTLRLRKSTRCLRTPPSQAQ